MAHGAARRPESVCRPGLICVPGWGGEFRVTIEPDAGSKKAYASFASTSSR